ncbi:transcriptional regulator, XRE family protein (plasmid) [Streptomyces sp. AM 4-1-1]|uniref:transcriptional regulator, XRE family protein n=1 Tax=Streptomyces sp. AM 4-1-1 TaxID=3028710 RepID=UPI0023B89EF5|nr:transcriptional regulator, XRE family protein [Streptomyces sp. AM 4-1-1]WEH37865.1 transcriptional regulator, XRE family protein [Streptomyces sp. AM 4-1-1]
MTHSEGSQTRTVVPLLFHLLDAPELNCASPTKFRVLWPIMAEDAAKALQEPRLARVRPSPATYKRWLAGTHIPRGDLRTILEAYFGKKAEALFQLVPIRDFVHPRPLDRRTRTAVRTLDYTWPTSRHVPGDPDAGIFGNWELAGGRHFDGTSIGVQIYEAQPRGDVMKISSADLPHLETFVRSSRRGVILASPGAAGGSGLYVMDAALARQNLAVGQDSRVPLAYELDDLVYAIIWALHVMDDGLLADDNPLFDRAEQLRHYVRISNSAPPRSEMPDLSPIGAAWLGSSLCAQFIVRHLGDLPEVPAFWTREATGEECAPWLLFRHKHDYLQNVADRFAGPGNALGRAFCVPESVVRSSETYERILLFITIAMMEMYGVKVWLTAEPEYQEVEGFVLASHRAILANWVRGESVWRVATTSARREVAPYQEVIGYARAHSLVDGPTPAARLAALADYLDLDWTWLTGRGRSLAEEGLTGMLRPRSRLLTLSALDRTLCFLGRLGGPADNR